MARRYARNDLPGQEARPTSNLVSIAGLVKLKPNRKKNKTWRPLQLSDFGEEENNELGGSENEESYFADNDSNNPGPGPSRQSPSLPRASPFEVPPVQTHPHVSPPTNRSTALGAESANIEHVNPTDTKPGAVVDYTRFFGRQLPDPIRLSEEIGSFDGQVMYIGHPNRDISAHQWRSDSFMWVHLGLYSHTRGRIEGALASDRLEDVTFPPHTLEYFRAAVEQREKEIVERGHSEEKPSFSPKRPHQEPLYPASTHLERVAPPSSPSDSGSDRILPMKIMAALHRGEGHPNRGKQKTSTITGEYLDDPFVTPAKPLQPVVAVTPAINTLGSEAPRATTNFNLAGTMNFDFKFPIVPTMSRPSSSVHPAMPTKLSEAERQHYREKERERIRRELHRDDPPPVSTLPALPPVAFGEEATSGYEASPPVWYPSASRRPFSPEDIRNREKIKKQLTELGERARPLPHAISAGMAIPEAGEVRMPNRPFRHPPGLTVANPHRVISTLNANAAPYNYTSTHTQVTQYSDLEAAANAPNDGNLRFSEPDSHRRHLNRDIATANHGQTQQNWAGPFFTDTKPTTHDPGASLAFHVGWEEDLRNWFQDGQHPARRAEYTRSLMATAEAEARICGHANFGAIGEGRPPTQVSASYENTPVFVALYETLREYVDKPAGDGKSDYFTRNWKPAPPDMCDRSLLGNNSFFDEGYDASFKPAPVSTSGGSRALAGLVAAGRPVGTIDTGKTKQGPSAANRISQVAGGRSGTLGGATLDRSKFGPGPGWR